MKKVLSYIHLSDIHFGQERGSSVFVRRDVMGRLLEDVKKVTQELPLGKVDGVIITGDIAYSGKQKEYEAAAIWLDSLCEAAGCAITDIQVVPGNHDIDRSEITSAVEMMIKAIVEGGEPVLDRFLEAEADRELFYRRFLAYQPFAEAYNCPLDKHGGAAGDQLIQIAPGRFIRFYGLNTALICSNNDVQGKLLLGERQMTLPREDGVELIVLAHHPLHWFQDTINAKRYIRNRARVFISGHEHDPNITIERVDGTNELMHIAAGATIPPNADGQYTYNYNFIQFAWNADTDSLTVNIQPRTWSDVRKTFILDEARASAFQNYNLTCPNFICCPPQNNGASTNPAVSAEITSQPNSIASHPQKMELKMKDTPEYKFALLRFFRDLTPAHRLELLVKLGALKSGFSGIITHSTERVLFDRIVTEGRLAEIEEAIRDFGKFK